MTGHSLHCMPGSFFLNVWEPSYGHMTQGALDQIFKGHANKLSHCTKGGETAVVILCLRCPQASSIAMASNLIAMASTLLAMASSLLAMASNLLVTASNLLTMPWPFNQRTMYDNRMAKDRNHVSLCLRGIILVQD